MKRLFIASVMALGILAISCEKAEEVILPAFPESQEMTFTSIGEAQEYSFSTNSDWTLVSSVAWCKFIDGKGDECNTIRGEKGNCAVKVIVTDEGLQAGRESDKARIYLIMKDEKREVLTVIRMTKEFQLALLDAEGKPISLEKSVIEVGYKEYIPFTVKANFPFFVKSQPKWVEFKDGPVNGAIGQVVTAKARLIADGQNEKYPIEASDKNVISFSDRDGKAVFNIKVKYAGMPSGRIEIESAGPRKDWNVSMDGTTYTQEGSIQGAGEGDIFFENELSASVKTLDDKFDLLFLEEYNDSGMLMIGSNLDGNPAHPVDWMKVSNAKGDLKISVGPSTADRHGWVLALPEGCGITAENWFEELIVMENDMTTGSSRQLVNYDAAEPYLVAELIQAEPKEEGSKEFEVFYNDTMSGMRVDISYEKSTDMGIISEYGIEDVYEIHQESNSININPLLTENWDFQAWNHAGEDASNLLARDGNMLNIWFETPLLVNDPEKPEDDQYVIIVIRTGNDPWTMIPKKILVIRPNL